MLTVTDSHHSKLVHVRAQHWLQILLLWFISQSLLAYDLTGTVYGDANPLPAATVHLYDSGQSPLSDATTDGAGAYSFTSLSDGTYWLNVTPPSGSEYSASPLEQVVVTGGNVTHTIVLLSSVGVQVTGTVRNPAGIPIQFYTWYGVRLKNLATKGLLKNPDSAHLI